MATSVFDDVTAEYRLLVDVLLRLPRHPQREQRGLWRRAVEIAPRLEPNGGRPPVAAVAIEPREEGDTLVVLLADEPGFDPVALAKRARARAGRTGALGELRRRSTAGAGRRLDLRRRDGWRYRDAVLQGRARAHGRRLRVGLQPHARGPQPLHR